MAFDSPPSMALQRFFNAFKPVLSRDRRRVRIATATLGGALFEAFGFGGALFEAFGFGAPSTSPRFLSFERLDDQPLGTSTAICR